MVDVEADDVAVNIEIGGQTFGDFTRFGARRTGQPDIEAVRLRIIPASSLVLDSRPELAVILLFEMPMRVNPSWDRFYRSMQRALPKQNANLELNLRHYRE